MAKLKTHREGAMAHQEETDTHTCSEEMEIERDPRLMLSTEHHHEIPN
jgi:hypothetical protein